MTPENVDGFGKVVDSILKVFAGNAGGFVISWLLIGVLGYVLYKAVTKYLAVMETRLTAMDTALAECRTHHSDCERQNQHLTHALIDYMEGRKHEAGLRARMLLNPDGELSPNKQSPHS